MSVKYVFLPGTDRNEIKREKGALQM